MRNKIVSDKFEAHCRSHIEYVLGISKKDGMTAQEILEDDLEAIRRKEYILGYMEGAATLLITVLRNKLGDISQDTYDQLSNMSIMYIESLTETALDFSTVADLQDWLEHMEKLKQSY